MYWLIELMKRANPNNNNRYNGFKVEELDLMINNLSVLEIKFVLRIENSVEKYV